MNEVPKLPQARMYLQAAQWGFDELLTKQLSEHAFRFYLIGILASLRAVQHAYELRQYAFGRAQASRQGLVSSHAAHDTRTAFHPNVARSAFEARQL